MDAVILFSHGSVLCGAGEALIEHAERMRTHGGFEIVEVGYLNYSDPPFLDAVCKCIEHGAARIFVVPYFLVPGKFVSIDLPKAIDEARRQFPDLMFVTADAIGYDDALADAILDSASHALPEDHWRDDLKHASRHCLNHPVCPLYGTKDCPRHPSPAATGVLT